MKELRNNWIGILPHTPEEIAEMVEQGLKVQKEFYRMSDTGIKAKNYPNAIKWS